MVIAAGSHLFPFRTEKLSPPSPMVLPPAGGRVGSCRFYPSGDWISGSVSAFFVPRRCGVPGPWMPCFMQPCAQQEVPACLFPVLCHGRWRTTFTGISTADVWAKRKPSEWSDGLAVEIVGVEPTTLCLQSRCSSQLSYTPDCGCKYGIYF